MPITFTNLDKIYYPKINATKGEVIDYYHQVSKYILPHLHDRPLTIKRYPEGINGPKIYQRHLDLKSSKFQIPNSKIYVKEKKTIKNFILCQDLGSLLYLAQLGTIELHPWYSTINPSKPDKTRLPQKFTSTPSLEKSVLNYPTGVVFDIDPPSPRLRGAGPASPTGFRQAVEVALATEKLLKRLKLKSFVKTSGKKGLHICIPIKRHYNFARVRAFACGVGEQLLHEAAPITMETRLKKRPKNKVFFDCNQNSIGKSLVAVYSLRATPQATVSFPVEWERLRRVRPTDFTITKVPRLLAKKGDTWRALLASARNDKLL